MLKSNSKYHELRWDKSNLDAYYNDTGVMLSTIESEVLSNSQFPDNIGNSIIDHLYDGIVGCLMEASNIHVQKFTQNFFQILVKIFFKFWWHDNLSELKIKSIDAHSLWKDNGRPRSGEIYKL